MMNTYDYNERLSSLDNELKTYSNDIINHITNIYTSSSSSSSINLKNDPRNLLKVFQHDINELVDHHKENHHHHNNSNNDSSNSDDRVTICSDIIIELDRINVITNAIILCEESISSIDIMSSCKLFKIVNDHLSHFNDDKHIIINVTSYSITTTTTTTTTMAVTINITILFVLLSPPLILLLPLLGRSR